jgi:hypothetical protein
MTLVSVVEDLFVLRHFCSFGIANHRLGADKLDEGKVGLHCHRGSHGRLSRVGRSVQQDGNERGDGRVSDGGDVALTVVEDMLGNETVSDRAEMRPRRSVDSHRPQGNIE